MCVPLDDGNGCENLRVRLKLMVSSKMGSPSYFIQTTRHYGRTSRALPHAHARVTLRAVGFEPATTHLQALWHATRHRP